MSKCGAFSGPNTGKYGPEKTLYLDYSYQCNPQESMLVPNTPRIEEISIAPAERKQPYLLLADENCESLAFQYLFPDGKIGYRVERDVKLSPVKYSKQHLLSFSQSFVWSADYIFYDLSVTQQLKMNSQINVALKKVRLGQITAGILTNTFFETVKSFQVFRHNYRNTSIIQKVPVWSLRQVKQWGLPTSFMTVHCADLSWNE